MQMNLHAGYGIEIVDNSVPNSLQQEQTEALRRVDSFFAWFGRNMRRLLPQPDTHPDSLKQREAAVDALFSEMASGNEFLPQTGAMFVPQEEWMQSNGADSAADTAALDAVFSAGCDAQTRE